MLIMLSCVPVTKTIGERKMKKILSIVLSLCLISILFVACGQDAPESTDTSGTPTSQTDAEEITLTFMRTGTPEILHGIFDELIVEYETANPNIKIDMQDLGWGDAEKTLQTMSASQTLPDVMYHLPGTVFNLADKGLILDLAPYLDDELKSDMFPSILEAGQYAGAQYLIPCGGSTLMLWYNADLFEQAGLDPDSPPKTWDEFFTACDKLSAIDGVDPIGMYGKVAGGEITFVMESLFTTEYGGSAWDVEKGQYVYGNEDAKQATINTMQFMQDMTDYAQNSFVEYGRFDVRTLLRDEKVAMVFDLVNMANVIPEQLEDGSMRVATLPAGASNVNSSAVNVGGWFIPTNSEHPDEAWDFLSFLMETESQLAHATYGTVPMLQSEIPFSQEGYKKIVASSLENSYAEGISPKSNELWTAQAEYVQLLLLDEMTAAEAYDAIVADHEAIYE